MSLADEIPEQVAYIVVHPVRIIPKLIGAQTHIDWMAECLDAQLHSCLVRSSGDQIVNGEPSYDRASSGFASAYACWEIM